MSTSTLAFKASSSLRAELRAAYERYEASDWDAAEPLVRRLIARGLLDLYDTLGSIRHAQGQLDDAIDCYRKALALRPDHVGARNALIMVLDAHPDTTAAIAQRARDTWWQQHGARLYARRLPHLNPKDPERPLRIGYVSADFRLHSAAMVFDRIAREPGPGLTSYFYSSTLPHQQDAATELYRQTPGWRDCVGVSDATLASRIIADGIDILVDLSGYTNDNRLRVFAQKPAPVQISAWGYATGVGWPAMDYLCADPMVIPPDRQHEHVERVIHLSSVIGYEGDYDLPITPLPCLTRPPTFAVFQRALKFNEQAINVWRQILERLPESRLLIKGEYCASFQRWLLNAFGAQAMQVQILGLTTHSEHLQMYHDVDLSLDTWPQTGGVTSCESLWMGVPVLTLIGARVIQRTTASLLSTLGLGDCIATSEAAYIETAVWWATEGRTRLAEWRAALRPCFVQSPICAGYREAVEQIYREVWRVWCGAATGMTIH